MRQNGKTRNHYFDGNVIINEVSKKVAKQFDKNMLSNLGSINWRDIVKGIAMAVLVPVIGYVEQVVSSGNFNFDVPTLEKLAIAGFVAYLVKQFGTSSQGNLLGVGDTK